jgi:hypothetical protein
LAFLKEETLHVPEICFGISHVISVLFPLLGSLSQIALALLKVR